MPRDLFDLTPEQQNVIPFDAATLHQAEIPNRVLRALQGGRHYCPIDIGLIGLKTFIHDARN